MYTSRLFVEMKKYVGVRLSSETSFLSCLNHTLICLRLNGSHLCWLLQLSEIYEGERSVGLSLNRSELYIWRAANWDENWAA